MHDAATTLRRVIDSPSSQMPKIVATRMLDSRRVATYESGAIVIAVRTSEYEAALSSATAAAGRQWSRTNDLLSIGPFARSTAGVTNTVYAAVLAQ